MPETRPACLDSHFKVLPVLDLMRGHVVRGVAGDRRRYRPLDVESEPVHVVQCLRERFGPSLANCYVADLDALQGKAPQHALLVELLRAEAPRRLWLDAGLRGVADVDAWNAAIPVDCHRRVNFVIALETIRSWADLNQIVSAVGGDQLLLSLDLVHGRVRSPTASIAASTPGTIARRVIDAGIKRLIVLDIAQVGMRQGISTLDLCRELARLEPSPQLITGGGVRSVEDLVEIRDAGCTGALVATALHDKSITADQLAQFVGT